MKLRNLFMLMVFAVAFTFNSCVDDDNYTTPKSEVKNPGLTATNTIQSIKGMFEGNTVDFSEVGDGLIIEGYVSSSDEGGNIYKAIYIQDKPENPSAAIQLIVDASDMYTFYEVGRKVFVKLDGLGLSDYKGMLQIGALKGTKVTRISSASYKQIIVRAPETATMVPLALAISDITDSKLGMLVQIEDVHAKTKGQTYVDAGSNYGSNRTFKNCEGKSILMRNSAFASFKARSIPDKRGTITAILGKYSKDYQLTIRSSEDVNFTEPYDCGGTINAPGSVTELNETFDNVSKDEDIELKDWTNANISGSRKWVGTEFKGEKAIKNSGYGYKGGDEIESWLVTPGLNLDGATNKNFSFKTKTGYSKNEKLEVFISSDFKGDVSNATWNKLNGATIAPATPNGYGAEYTDSGDIDLSSYSGTVYVAFKYSGNGTDKTGTYQIDDVKFNYTSSGNSGGNNGSINAVEELNESFDTVIAEKDINLTDWTVTTSSGSRNWIGKERNGVFYTQISGFKYAGGDEMVSWLVTPGLKLDNATNKNFSFKSKTGHSKGETLEVLISTDFTGDVSKATWNTLNGATIAPATPNGYGAEFTDSGDIDLSSYSGTVYVAFKYSGNGTTNTGTYQIDDVKFNYTPDNNSGGNNGGGNNGGSTTGGSLFFSEYVEGSSNNKYIEIYNGTGKDIDLSAYKVELYTNGATEIKKEEVLSGTLAAGEVYVIYNKDSDTSIVDEGDLESTITWFNGDDAIVLKKNDTIIDVIGLVGEDPGKAWEVEGVSGATKDHTLIRKSSVTKGNPDWASSAASEWDVKDKDDFSSVGKK